MRWLLNFSSFFRKIELYLNNKLNYENKNILNNFVCSFRKTDKSTLLKLLFTNVGGKLKVFRFIFSPAFNKIIIVRTRKKTQSLWQSLFLHHMYTEKFRNSNELKFILLHSMQTILNELKKEKEKKCQQSFFNSKSLDRRD